MSGDMRRSYDLHEMDRVEATLVTQRCPDGSMLLAYTRRQEHEDWPEISQHLERCEDCRLRCNEYVRIGASLGVLAQMQRYPSLVDGVFHSIQEADEQGRLREEGRSYARAPVSLRIISIPVAVALVLLFAAVMMTLASSLTGGPRSWWHFQPPSQVKGGEQPYSTSVLAHKPTLTVLPARTGSPSNVSTSTPTSGIHPYIKICSTSEDITQSRLRICGYNFTPHARVMLIVDVSGPDGGSKGRHPVLADAYGQVQDSWIISNCKNVPISIVAVDIDNKSEMSQTLQNISFDNCPVPSTTGKH